MKSSLGYKRLNCAAYQESESMQKCSVWLTKMPIILRMHLREVEDIRRVCLLRKDL